MIKYLDELKSLNLPKGKFAIFGSGPIVIRNLRENKDLDILVTHDLWNMLSKKYPITSKNERPDTIYIDHIQILEVNYKDWNPHITDSSKLISEAEIINGFPFVRLEHLLGCKKMMSGEKHFKDVEIIQEYLNNKK